jgi:hypothetical protein
MILAEAGAQPQRLLWASTGTKDPQAPDVLYLIPAEARTIVNDAFTAAPQLQNKIPLEPKP